MFDRLNCWIGRNIYFDSVVDMQEIVDLFVFMSMVFNVYLGV